MRAHLDANSLDNCASCGNWSVFDLSDLSVCSEQQPCQHGATCVMEDSGDYTCLCPEGFHGRNCQLKVGPCHQRRCVLFTPSVLSAPDL